MASKKGPNDGWIVWHGGWGIYLWFTLKPRRSESIKTFCDGTPYDEPINWKRTTQFASTEYGATRCVKVNLAPGWESERAMGK